MRPEEKKEDSCSAQEQLELLQDDTTEPGETVEDQLQPIQVLDWLPAIILILMPFVLTKIIGGLWFLIKVIQRRKEKRKFKSQRLLSTFELSFGASWTALSVLVTVMFYCGDENATVIINGVPTSRGEFNEMLGPKILLGGFIFIGLMFMFRGLKKVIINKTTASQGMIRYGYIVETYFNGASANGRQRQNACIWVLVDGVVQTFEEDIGFNHLELFPGDYVKVKHHNNDVNLLEVVPDYEAPFQLKEHVEEVLGYSKCYDEPEVAPDTIVVNGVEYVRKDDN